MHSLTDRLKRAITQHGILGAVPMCWYHLAELFKPAGRRATATREEVDTAFDSSHGVETGGIVRPKRRAVVGGNWAYGIKYQAVDPSSFMKALDEIAIPHHEFTFIDFGSGKGRALLLASGYPFHRVIGVEYCESLNQIARRNLLHYPTSARRCDQVEIVGMDAAEYAIPDEPLVLFFFHPFARPVMARVVKNVAESFRRRLRRIVVIYFTPWFADLWDQVGFLGRVQSAPAVFDTEARPGEPVIVPAS